MFNVFRPTSHAFPCTHRSTSHGHSKMCCLIGSVLIVCLKNLSNRQCAQTPIRVNKHTQPHAHFSLRVLNSSLYLQLPSLRGQLLSVTEPTQILIMWIKAMMLRCSWSKAAGTPPADRQTNSSTTVSSCRRPHNRQLLTWEPLIYIRGASTSKQSLSLLDQLCKICVYILYRIFFNISFLVQESVEL